jgi:hypothetical protein
VAKPDIILIGGHAYRWQEICELRRQQLQQPGIAEERLPAGLVVALQLRDVLQDHPELDAEAGK